MPSSQLSVFVFVECRVLLPTLTCKHGLTEIVVSLGVEYLVACELYGYICNSYVAAVVHIGQRKVKDIEVPLKYVIEVPVKYVIEGLFAVFHVFFRTVPFEFFE